MHQLGFWHEHERDDRQEHIEINWFKSYRDVWKGTCSIKQCTEFKKFPYDNGYIYKYTKPGLA